MTSSAPLVAITGANGYLGSCLVNAFRNSGAQIRVLVRNPGPTDADAVRWSLEHPDPQHGLDGVDVLIHAAYDLRARSWSDVERINIGGSRALLRHAAQAGVKRTIVVSSITAYPGTRQLYGRAKLEIEQAAGALGAISVRPGLIWGTRPGSMLAALSRMAKLPLVPVPAAKSHQYMAHEDDVAATVVALAHHDNPRQLVTVAHPRAVPMRELILTLALAQGSHPILMPLAPLPLLLALRSLEAAGARAPFKADSLWGLAHPPPPPDLGPLEMLKITPRAFTVEELAASAP